MHIRQERRLWEADGKESQSCVISLTIINNLCIIKRHTHTHNHIILDPILTPLAGMWDYISFPSD